MERGYGQNYDWGDSYISRLIADYIDQTVSSHDVDCSKGMPAKYVRMLLVPLQANGIETEVMEHLQIDFIRCKEKDPETGPENKDLGKIQDILLQSFGHEVVKRLRISISPNSVRELSQAV